MVIKSTNCIDENSSGELIKENLQEWMCDNRFEITSCISIALNLHERTYSEWFRYVDACSGPDKLALYCLSRKYGVHTAVYNKGYVWTTLMNHITLTDVEIFNLCKVRLIYLGPAKYGILRDIKHPSPGSIAQRASPSSERKPDNTKKRGRKTTCRKGKQATECRPDSNTLPVKKPRTLSENRNLRYGITNPTPATVTVAGRTRHSCRKDIDYLSLNDGLESEFMDTPKRKPKNSHPPNRKGPTPQRVAAQCASLPETFPEAESAVTMSGSTALIGVLASSSNKSNVTQVSASSTTALTGIQLPLAESLTAPSLTGVPVSTTLIGVPASGSNKNIVTHVSAPSITALTGVQVPPAESPTASSLTGVPIMPDTTTTAPKLTKPDDALDSLPDLVLDDKVGR